MAGLELVVVAVPAAAVARLVFVLISDITKAAEKARENKVECEHLKGRVSHIGRLLHRLKLQDPEVAEALAGLRDTLLMAHDLVVACQKSNGLKKLFCAGEQAAKFKKVNDRIDSHLLDIQLLSQISLTHRLDQILSPDATTMVASASAMVPGPGKGFDSRSLQLKEPAKVAYVGSTSTHAAAHFTSVEIAVLTGNYGQEVAVKSLKNHGSQREGAFVAEIEILRNLRHNHIVRLVGWCTEDDERMFVYQYQHTSNGTLRDHLTPGGSGGSASASPVTSSWKARLQALLGAAGAIDHLHRFAVPGIIHRNVSSSSILLDKSCVPCLSDFGAAILQVPTTGGQHVGDVVGKVGYTDPEYCRTRCVSPASDVYSFGVVILEVLTGRPPSWEGKDPNTLVGFAVPAIESRNLRSVLDRRPSPEPTPRQMEALELVAYTATRCLWQQDRPFMANVVINLHTALGFIDGDKPKELQWS
ncbi:unnamed protein product [Triticum turgidum subsp. durum]|uniref:Protein kinase domain-containing protein n=1 Tax=Triticum turgidum subsp. durum TaxID=4567 RepID=A0A9R1P6P8_TRITD|nr:unnamed protein product [Triticum turgidum subsp. durum]